MAASKYDKSLAATIAVRPRIAAEFLPLFDHCINLAANSHKHGNYKRAGRELLHARRLERFSK